MQHVSATTTTRIGICLHAYVLDQFDTAGRSLGRSRERIHSGIHEARKSIRRIRAALDLGRANLWPDAAGVFDELKNLCRGLSVVRDAHAVIETLDGLFRQSKDPDLRTLLRSIRQKLIKRQAASLSGFLKQDPGFRRYRVRLRLLRDHAEALPWSAIDATAIRSALARSERRADRVARTAERTRHGQMRHRWRRRLRRLRHQMMILESALNWRFIDPASPDTREAISTPEWSAIVDETIANLESKADALAFEHDLRLLRTALRNTAGIKQSDRDKTLKLVRRKINQASRR
jgi:hypothetical protein